MTLSSKHNKLLLKHLKLLTFWTLSIIKCTKNTKKQATFQILEPFLKHFFSSNFLHTSCLPNFKSQVVLHVINNENSYRTELLITVLQSLKYVAHIAYLKV